MKIGQYEVIEHTETVSPFRFVVFTNKGGKLERANVGKRGGFRTWDEAVDAVTKLSKFGTVNV